MDNVFIAFFFIGIFCAFAFIALIYKKYRNPINLNLNNINNEDEEDNIGFNEENEKDKSVI
jgi:hypothetical protein